MASVTGVAESSGTEYFPGTLKEQDALRLVKSLVISRLTYSLPYHNMNREEKEKADKIIRHIKRLCDYHKALQLRSY